MRKNDVLCVFFVHVTTTAQIYTQYVVDSVECVEETVVMVHQVKVIPC